MQPYVITLPDTIRDAMARDFRGPIRQRNAEEYWNRNKHRLFGDTQGKRLWHDNDAISADIVAKHLFNLHPTEEDRPFLQDFQERFLRMMDGSGHPVLLLKNLPPGTDRMVMDGLARMTAGSVDHQFIFPKESNEPQPIHRDSTYDAQTKKKPLQFVYCRTAGEHRQPTNFVTADEALQKLAETTGESLESLAERLEATRVHHITRPSHPFLIKNPHPAPGEGAVRYIDLGDAPGRWPHQRSNNMELIKAYRAAANTCAIEQNDTAMGSTEPHTLLIWNENFVLHGRGQAQGTSQSDRELLVDKTFADTASASTPFGHIAQGPVSHVELARARAEREVGPDGVVRRR